MELKIFLIKFNNIRIYDNVFIYFMSYYSYFSFAAPAVLRDSWFYGKKVGQLSEANSRIQKKPNTNE
jgi:hypothetical protein